MVLHGHLNDCLMIWALFAVAKGSRGFHTLPFLSHGVLDQEFGAMVAFFLECDLALSALRLRLA